MNKLFDPENKFFTAVNILGDHLLLGVVWLVFSLPVVTLGAASTAVCWVSRRVLEQSGVRLLRDFWAVFCREFKRSTLLWLTYLAVGLVLATDAWFYLSAQTSQWASVLLGVFIMIGLVYFACLLWVFPYISRVSCKYGQAIKMSFLFGAAHLGTTVLMLLVPAGLFLLSVYFTWLVIFLPGVILLGEGILTARVFRKYEKKREPEDTPSAK